MICVGGPLVYDSVRLVQNSVALNGSQRVLLDNVISEKECSELRDLAHVRILYNINKISMLNKQISHEQQKASPCCEGPC